MAAKNSETLGGLGLRARISLAFAIGGLVLSLVLAGATLALTRQNLVADRSETSFVVATNNGRRVKNRLAPDADMITIIESLTATEGSYPLIRFGDEWTAANPEIFGRDDVPESLQTFIDNQSPARMSTTVSDQPALLTGLPIPGVDATYYEAVFLGDIERTLTSLGFILFGGAAVTTALAAALGWWASRRALRPLMDFRTAAESLAAGELDTRLDQPADADLAALSVSFNDMAAALEDRIGRDARFASEVSHELRSPLMTLTASLEVLQNGAHELSERGQLALGLLGEDIIRFINLVEDLLEISRYDVGTASLSAEPVNIVEFVRQAVEHASPDRIPVVVEPAVIDVVIRADKRRLAQVVANLVQNAQTYGSSIHRVTVEAADGEHLLIAVEDNGAGVPESEREVIFDRFSRGSAGGRRGPDSGSGLGLALVTEHIALHGGRVWVEDRFDGESGARFVVELPLNLMSDELDHELV